MRTCAARTADRIAERTVKCRRKLCRIGHDRSLLKAIAIQRVPNRTDPSVHHVRRSHDIDTCLRSQHSHLGEDFHGRIIG